MSEGRLESWNHDVIPMCLRTKLPLEVEEEEKKVIEDRMGRQADQLTKQVNFLKKI